MAMDPELPLLDGAKPADEFDAVERSRHPDRGDDDIRTRRLRQTIVRRIDARNRQVLQTQVLEVHGATVIVWELRRWIPELSRDPDAVGRLSTWHHLLAEGFALITDKAELQRRTGWTQD